MIDYEKAYNVALERAKEIYYQDRSFRRKVLFIFPQLSYLIDKEQRMNEEEKKIIEEYIKKEHEGITLHCCVKATLSP